MDQAPRKARPPYPAGVGGAHPVPAGQGKPSARERHEQSHMQAQQESGKWRMECRGKTEKITMVIHLEYPRMGG